jgi:hypothetical protein
MAATIRKTASLLVIIIAVRMIRNDALSDLKLLEV